MPAEKPLAYPGKPAVRQRVKGRIALSGVSKQGKTLAALAVARGLVGPEGIIYLVDTDNGSAKLYAGTRALVTEKQPTGFDSANLTPPYHPDRFTTQLRHCAEWGVDCIILDTVTAEWSGTGGMQEIVDEFKRRGGGTGWDKAVPLHNRFLNAIIQCPAHVIATVRLKSDTKVETGDDGKLKIRKVGLKPEQRDQFDYEFTIIGVFDNHDLMLEGRGGFAERVHRAHEDTGNIEAIASGYIDLGREIGAWLNSGEAPPAPNPHPDGEKAGKAAPPAGETPEPMPADPEASPPAGEAAETPRPAAEAGQDAPPEGETPPPAGDALNPPPAQPAAMTTEQETVIAAKLGELAATRDGVDWSALLDGKAQEYGVAGGWRDATGEAITQLLETLEKTILSQREAAGAAS